MKVIIAGSRHISDSEELEKLIKNTGWEINEVVSGNCRGVDEMGEQWAEKQNIPVKQFMADWTAYGREAGELRNRDMAEYADGLILLWDGKSPGSSCMLRESAKAGISIKHLVHGLNMDDMSDAELKVLNYYWEGKGQLVYNHEHWEWDVARKEAPPVVQEAIHGLIEQGLLEATTVTVLQPVKEKFHSRFA